MEIGELKHCKILVLKKEKDSHSWESGDQNPMSISVVIT